VIALYILVSLCTVGTLSISAINKAKEYVLAEAARPALGQPGFILITIAALLSTFSAVKSTLYGTTRTTARIASASQMPSIIARRFSGRPLIALFSMAAVTLIVANTVNLRQIAIMGSAGFLALFTFINLVCSIQHKKVGSRLWLSLIATLFACGSLAILFYHTATIDPIDFIPVACHYGFSLLYGILYVAFRKKQFN